jgi:hypothetical protein
MNQFENVRDRHERELFASVESMLRAASDQVRVSDDLRADTIAAAQLACRGQNWQGLWSTVAACSLLLAGCGFLLNHEAGPTMHANSEQGQAGAELDFTASKGVGSAAPWFLSLFSSEEQDTSNSH